MKYSSLLMISLSLLVFISCKKETQSNPSGYCQYGKPVSSIPAIEDLVIYEVSLRAFSNAGNLAGVTERLQEIKALGVNTIWLMPIYTEGVLNNFHNPYCVKNFKEVSAEYGSLADLRKLIDQAHALNMIVILDWVANDTSWDNPWITEHDDWYTKNSDGQIITGVGSTVAKLDFSNLAMQDAMIDAMKYWVLVANVDGFRCSWADRVPFTFWNKAISDLKKIPNRHLLFVSDGTKSEYYTAGFDLTFSREFKYHLNYCWAAAPATNLYFNHILEYLSVPYGKHKLRYTTYHEESNPITQFNGLDGALAASIPTIFMYGVPLIYSGQEVGCPMYPNLNPQSFIDWNANPSMLKNYKDVMAFYTSSEAARKGSVSNFSNSAVVFFKKARDAEELLVMTNTHNVDVTFSIPLEFQVKHWVNALTNESITLSSELHLSPFQFLLLKNE